MTVGVFYLVVFSNFTCPRDYFQLEEAVIARLAVWEFDASDSLIP
jgi:hypothetical protein